MQRTPALAGRKADGGFEGGPQERRLTPVLPASAPHRDDLSLSISGISARSFGSQGQQRSVVLALKLSEAQLLLEATGKNRSSCLDDVLSELDVDRQDYLLHSVDGWRFITCCDPVSVMRQKRARPLR